MKSTKVDPVVAKIQKKALSKACNLSVPVSATVGFRVVAFAVVKPKTMGEYLKLKSNPAITVSARTLGGDLYTQLYLDGKELSSMCVEKFGRCIDYVMLRVNDILVDKVPTNK